MRDSFVFYRSFYEALEDLPPKDFKEAALAIMQYALDGVEPKTTGVGKSVYKIAKCLIDRNNQRYENGKKGGRPHNQTETETYNAETETKPSDNQTVTEPKPNRNQTQKTDNQTETRMLNVNDMLLNNNINTTHACAHAREEVSISDFEAAVGCEGWERYPNSDVYVELRDVIIGLINDGEVSLDEISNESFGSLLESMYKGRDRRPITDLRAWALGAVKNNRRHLAMITGD